MLELETTTVNRAIWTKINRDRYQSGTFQVRCNERYKSKSTGDYEFQRWYVYQRINGRWELRFPSQRKYGYGSAGSAKRGAAMICRQHDSA